MFELFEKAIIIATAIRLFFNSVLLVGENPPLRPFFRFGHDIKDFVLFLLD